METVFDYNITDEERKRIGIPDKAFYMTHFGNDPISNNIGLAYLFHARNNEELMTKYADKLPDDMKLDFYRTISHP